MIHLQSLKHTLKVYTQGVIRNGDSLKVWDGISSFGYMEKVKYIGFSITCFAILFKLMSWQYADKLLIAGLGSLGVYYLIKVFKK